MKKAFLIIASLGMLTIGLTGCPTTAGTGDTASSTAGQ